MRVVEVTASRSVRRSVAPYESAEVWASVKAEVESGETAEGVLMRLRGILEAEIRAADPKPPTASSGAGGLSRLPQDASQAAGVVGVRTAAPGAPPPKPVPVVVRGDTMPVKARLRDEFGLRWDAQQRAWVGSIPPGRLAMLRQIPSLIVEEMGE